MNARPGSRAFLLATAVAVTVSFALPPTAAFSQTTGPSDRANTQQGTAAGQMPAQTGGGDMSSGGPSSATTGPSNRANSQQGTASGTTTKKHAQQHTRKRAGNGQHKTAHSGTSGSGTAPTGGPMNKANSQQGTAQ